MKKLSLIGIIISAFIITGCQDQHPQTQIVNKQQKANPDAEGKNINIILDMFADLSENKNIEHLDRYFTSDFELETNLTRLNYAEFKKFVNSLFKSIKKVQIKRPITNLYSTPNHVISKFSVITTDTTGLTHLTEIIALYQIKENKIARWWSVYLPIR